jgi:hypothetical protein
LYQHNSAIAGAFYSYNYTALTTAPTLQFGFHNNGGMDYSYVDDVSVVATSAPLNQLLVNPGFENSTSVATGWITWCQPGGCGTGNQGKVINNSTCYSGNCFVDHCTNGYDYLTQSFSATIGSTYNISFRYYQTGGPMGQIYVNIAG